MTKEQFSIELKDCIISIYDAIEDKEELISFGIYTDQDVSSMVVKYNTRNHFAEQLKDVYLRYGEIASDYRWRIPEWFNRVKNAKLDELNVIMIYTLQPLEFETGNEFFKDTLLDLIFEVLKEVQNEGLFRSQNEDFIVCLEQTDSGIDKMMRARIKALNSPKMYENFLYEMRSEIYG
jgi:Domain of unknown function (DUF4303)